MKKTFKTEEREKQVLEFIEQKGEVKKKDLESLSVPAIEWHEETICKTRKKRIIVQKPFTGRQIRWVLERLREEKKIEYPTKNNTIKRIQ